MVAPVPQLSSVCHQCELPSPCLRCAHNSRVSCDLGGLAREGRWLRMCAACSVHACGSERSSCDVLNGFRGISVVCNRPHHHRLECLERCCHFHLVLPHMHHALLLISFPCARPAQCVWAHSGSYASPSLGWPRRGACPN